MSGIDIQILDARLKQEEIQCSRSFTSTNSPSLGTRLTFSFWSGHLILLSFFAGLFMRTSCPHGQTCLRMGRPCPVLCSFDCSTNVTLLVRDHHRHLFLLPPPSHRLPLLLHHHHLQVCQPSDRQTHQTKGQGSTLSREHRICRSSRVHCRPHSPARPLTDLTSPPALPHPPIQGLSLT